ncbi:hypothetical protein [Clostridium beijerinckii]|uniref:hypothetical protein n=1 Tax=Clostridium beijerinckii TaxID=1520 RepID=UPI00098C4FBA|nr:hypothetical protein [Clostridium beijerinckii]NRU38927.1 hypothetical protein [Clostridium beijerinckii]NSA97794.1 hypothetical protein [Clostridium beijerinckii]OOM68670.1 hypothetical protein CLOBI_02250 [Clostridium beijerinckii]OOM72621.1 hypothetical protein CLBEIC_06300 [Clostridium beijerinckii]CUU48424.1 conserved protein of unknown function [Clostridium beijerinckii]
MVYISEEFLNDKYNLNKVYEILNKLDYDIKGYDDYTEEDAIKELKELNEDIIIEKLNSGFFTFGA